MKNDKNIKSLVSIIVPAYNVEKYINKCVKSILAQTYKNIEIIVVDDGSTDNTNSIIKNIELTDKRIVFLSKKNAGVSAARNDGIRISNGEYIVFVDGDDFISNNYVEYMVGMAISSKAEFCLSLNCFTKAKDQQVVDTSYKIYNSVEATALLLSPRVIVGCWNKIYKKHFIINNNFYFDETLFYGEGLNFITKVSQKANYTCVGTQKVYYYRRDNIDSATTKFDIEKLRNGELSLYRIKESIDIKDDLIDDIFNLHMCMFSLGAIVKILASKTKNEHIKDYRKWHGYIKTNIFKIIRSKNVSVYRKLMLIGGCISPKLMMILDKKRREKIVKESVI